MPPPTPPHFHDLNAVLATAQDILAEGTIQPSRAGTHADSGRACRA